MGLVPFKGEKVAIHAASEETADIIGKRAQNSSAREISSLPSEALPYNADIDWSEIWGKIKEGGSDSLNNASEGMYRFEDKLKKWWGEKLFQTP